MNADDIATGERRDRCNLGLAPAQESRAQRLHDEAIVVDLLSQHAGHAIFGAYPEPLQREFQAMLDARNTNYERFIAALHWPYELSRDGKSDLIRDWLRQGGIACGTYGLEVLDPDDPAPCRWQAYASLYDELPWIRRVTSAEDIRAARRDSVIAIYAHCQPTGKLPRDLRAFDDAYARGLRSFMLTYNGTNIIGSGCTVPSDDGLSPFGHEVVAHCNTIGMIVDVSHCGRVTTLEACRRSAKPVTANHTAAQGRYQHARGKSDDELKAIADTGGLVGIVAVPAFLTGSSTPTLHDMLDHIDYVANLVGWRHVAIGTDWPLQAPVPILAELFAPANTVLGFREQDRLDAGQCLDGFKDCRDLPNITRGLVARGYDDEQIIAILGENALRVFEAVAIV